MRSRLRKHRLFGALAVLTIGLGITVASQSAGASNEPSASAAGNNGTSSSCAGVTDANASDATLVSCGFTVSPLCQHIDELKWCNSI